MPEYKIPSNKAPTYWNKEAAAGFVIGSIVPGVGSLLGAVIGSFVGKDRLENEQKYGKTVKEPTLLNMNMFPGIIKGGLVAMVLGVSLFVLLSATSPFTIPAITVLCTLAPAIGGFMGAQAGKIEMEKEYAQAQQLEDQQARGRGTSTTTERIAQHEHDYGPDHPALQAEQKGKVWTNDTKMLPKSPLLSASR